MNVEWDQQKNQTNIRKHGFSFVDAWEVFEAPMLVELDDREEYSEERWTGIGQIQTRTVVVVYSWGQMKRQHVSSRCERHLNMSDKPMTNTSRTDWERIDALPDEDIDTSDIPPLTNDFFKNAKLRLPRQRVSTTLQIDADVLTWFKAQGDDYEQRLNAALRMYAEAHKAATR